MQSRAKWFQRERESAPTCGRSSMNKSSIWKGFQVTIVAFLMSELWAGEKKKKKKKKRFWIKDDVMVSGPFCLSGKWKWSVHVLCWSAQTGSYGCLVCHNNPLSVHWYPCGCFFVARVTAFHFASTRCSDPTIQPHYRIAAALYNVLWPDLFSFLISYKRPCFSFVLSLLKLLLTSVESKVSHQDRRLAPAAWEHVC